MIYIPKCWCQYPKVLRRQEQFFLSICASNYNSISLFNLFDFGYGKLNGGMDLYYLIEDLT